MNAAQQQTLLKGLMSIDPETSPDVYRQALSELDLLTTPEDLTSRITLISGYLAVGDVPDALYHIAVALALGQENPAIMKMLTLRCVRKGQPDIGRLILERGWKYQRNLLGRNANREQYFSVAATFSEGLETT